MFANFCGANIPILANSSSQDDVNWFAPLTLVRLFAPAQALCWLMCHVSPGSSAAPCVPHGLRGERGGSLVESWGGVMRIRVNRCCNGENKRCPSIIL